jgi:hypothetical protein
MIGDWTLTICRKIGQTSSLIGYILVCLGSAERGIRASVSLLIDCCRISVLLSCCLRTSGSTSLVQHLLTML